jgi:hypothetical protein
MEPTGQLGAKSFAVDEKSTVGKAGDKGFLVRVESGRMYDEYFVPGDFDGEGKVVKLAKLIPTDLYRVVTPGVFNSVGQYRIEVGIA